MTSVLLASLIAATLFIGCTNLAVAYEQTGIIHVGGKVLCQDCTQGWKQWVNGAKPLKGCKVCLTCLDERRRVMYYVSDITDDQGRFDMIVSKYNIKGKELNTKLCFVRLVSSPDPTCNILTDFAGGKSGVNLLRPNSVYRDTIKYMLGPLYFTTPMCEKPDTNQSDDQGRDY